MRSPDPRVTPDLPRPERRSTAPQATAALAAVLAVLAVPTTMALARARSTRGTTVRAVVDADHNARLDATIAVDARGLTLYALSGETVHHLKCTSAACLKLWPPLTVASAHAVLREGPGVHGKLGELRRTGGVEQVTLRGLPLYRFVVDKAAGSVAGQSVSSFGGVWRSVTAAATGAGVVTRTPTTSTTTSASMGAPPPAPAGSTSATSTSSATSGATTTLSTVTSAVTTAATTSAPTSASTATASMTSSACTPYYVGSYYYPCP